jgi:N6-L-threonylcarbamoyladenine synthase
MIILAIETSCDDTCIAILEIKNRASVHGSEGEEEDEVLFAFQKSKIKSFEILSNVISSQVKLHAKYGGVYPMLAKREHQKNLPIVLKKTLKETKGPKIDLIAVTIGPGLEPCLWEGVNFAKDLAQSLKLPLVPVNHVEAHIIANFVGSNSKLKNRASIYGSEGEEEDGILFACQKSKLQVKIKNLFPAVCLVVSGGHTQLILMKDIGKYKILGGTRDDAAGECFDKVARILGLPYPGGPAIAATAAKFKIQNSKFKIKLPRPMIYQKNYDFSFSGLKTAVLYEVKGERFKVKDKRYIQEMCFEVQQAIIDVLIYKTLKATKEYKAKSIILGGGVTANDELRKQFQLTISNQQLAINFLVPPKIYCTDNAAMVALTGYFHRSQKEQYNLEKIKADANLRLE